MAIGFLYNSKDYKYPKGKLFYDQDEYDEALESGWNTGPADAAKAKRAQSNMKVEWEAGTVEEKPKPKTRRRKK